MNLTACRQDICWMTNTFPKSLLEIIADHWDYLTELITLNDFVNIFHFAFTLYKARKMLAINIRPRLLFKGKHSLNRQYHEAYFFTGDYVTCFFLSATAAYFTVNLRKTKALPLGGRGVEGRTSSRVSFTGVKGSPRPNCFWSRH